MRRFHDRSEAGRELAGHLERYAGRDDAVVLGLARGGMPVAYEDFDQTTDDEVRQLLADAPRSAGAG